MVYLSTGAWNAAPTIWAGSCAGTAIPPVPCCSPTGVRPTAGWFRSGPAHKVTQLRRLFTELPDVQWVLVGDDGQRDPQIYAGAAQRFPDHVRAILIRQLTFGEHVLAHGVPAPTTDAVRAEQSASPAPRRHPRASRARTGRRCCSGVREHGVGAGQLETLGVVPVVAAGDRLVVGLELDGQQRTRGVLRVAARAGVGGVELGLGGLAVGEVLGGGVGGQVAVAAHPPVVPRDASARTRGAVGGGPRG